MNETNMIVAIVAIALGALAPVLLLACVLYYKHRKLRLTHETILGLAAKGAPIPPEMLSQHCELRASDLRRGMVLFFIGAALSLFLYEVGAPWSLGLIPMFAGIGYLITWKLEGQDDPAPARKALSQT
jgi:hypothetical protein